MKNKRNHIKIIVVQYTLAFILALLIGSVLIYKLGESPLVAVQYILDGAFGSKVKLGNTLRWATPCLFTGIAVSVAFRSGIMNCGIQGQVYMGAIVAAIIGYAVPMPKGIHTVVCIVAAGIAGMAWALIPALLRLYFKVDELITSLMFCFIATFLTSYIVIWKIIGGKIDSTASQSNTSPPILDTAKIPTLIKGTATSYGIFLGLAIILIVFLVYRYTRIGYEMKQVGENMTFCKAGGVNVSRIYMGVFLVSGLIAGVCGGTEVCGSYGRFNINFSSNIGWDGIMIARIAENNPLAVVVVSLIWGALKAGAMHMERLTSLNRLTVNIIQMIFVLFVSVDYAALKQSWNEFSQTRKLKKAEGDVK